MGIHNYEYNYLHAGLPWRGLYTSYIGRIIHKITNKTKWENGICPVTVIPRSVLAKNTKDTVSVHARTLTIIRKNSGKSVIGGEQCNLFDVRWVMRPTHR